MLGEFAPRARHAAVKLLYFKKSGVSLPCSGKHSKKHTPVLRADKYYGSYQTGKAEFSHGRAFRTFFHVFNVLQGYRY